MQKPDNPSCAEVELAKAEALVQLRPHIERARRPTWFPWTRHARRQEIRRAAVAYLDVVLSAHMGSRLESQILQPDLDIEALAKNAIQDAINFVNEPLLTEVADAHREMLINAFRMTYLRNLKAQKELFNLFPAPPHPPHPEPNESIEPNKSSYEPLEEVEQPDAFIGWSEADEASAHTREPRQQPESINTEPLPSLPRAALQRIEQAERLAKERYDQDKIPYFPMNHEFSFIEESIFGSIARILSYLQVFATEVLDASLKEYLEYAPAALLTNGTLLRRVAGNTCRQVQILWVGYGHTLMCEPARRRARSILKMAEGTIDQYPELETWRYPTSERWAKFSARMAESDSEMARLNAQYDATMKQVVQSGIRHYQSLAIERLPDAEHPSALQRAEDGPPAGVSTEDTKPMAAHPNARTWQDIEMRFLSDERVQVIINGNLTTRNYAEMGFEDRRKGTPSLAWKTLQILATKNGDMDLDLIKGRNRTKVEKRVQEIRSTLRGHFQIDQDPVPFLAGIGYKTAFRIVWSRAADT